MQTKIDSMHNILKNIKFYSWKPEFYPHNRKNFRFEEQFFNIVLWKTPKVRPLQVPIEQHNNLLIQLI
jgi:hypothetical protein